MDDEEEFIVGPDRFVILHYNAHQRQLKREEVLAQIDDFESQHLYRPRITKKAKELAAKAAQRPGSPDTFERLHQYVEVVKVNRQVLEREVFKDCTFQPVVNPPGPRSRSPSPPRRGSGPPDDNDSSNLLPFPERLHPSEEQQREKRERLQRAKLQGEVRGCTFQPRVNKSRGLDVDVLGGGMGEDEEDGVLSGPVYERLNKYHAAQQMRLQILKQRQEEEEMKGVTFQPILCTPSRRRAPSPAAARRKGQAAAAGAGGAHQQQEEEEGGMDVFQRLHAQQYQHHNRRPADAKDPECTFQPQLQAGRRKSCSSFEELPMQERFQRYDQYKEAQQARRAREKEAEEMKECTFKPKLHKSPMRHRRRRPAAGTAPSSPTNGAARGPPAENNKGALWENGSEPDLSSSERLQQHELTTRLADSWRRRDEQRRKLKLEREMAGCTFRPSINHGKTPRKVKDEPVIARLLEAGTTARKKQQDRKQEKEKKEMERCTFQPSLVATARYKSPPRDPSDPPSVMIRRGRSRSPKQRQRGRSPAGRRSPRAMPAGHWAGPRPAWGAGGYPQYQRRPSSVDRASLSSGRMRSVSDRQRSYSPPHGSFGGGTADNSQHEAQGPPAIMLAPADDESLRLELNALPSPESAFLPSSPRGQDRLGPRSASSGTRSSSSINEAGSKAELLPPGERLRRFKEWRQQLAARLDSL